MTDNSTTHFICNDSHYNNVPKDVVTVSVHPAVTTIEDHAFFECTSLTTINIPNQVITIGNDAFQGCTSLSTINLPNQMICIGEGAFSGCNSLTSINIPDLVTTIDYRTFSGCTSLTTINIPNLVTTIGEGAFNGCTSLATINIPDLVTTIGSYAFSGCTSLEKIDVPNLVTTIEYCAFNGCTSLTTINIPNLVTTIGEHAFHRCTSLSAINIPDLVTTVRNCAFCKCTSLTTIIIPNAITTIASNAFSGCTSLTSINIPNPVTTIGYHAFFGCTSLEQRRQSDGNNNYHANTATWLRQRFDNLPLHQACYNNYKHTLTNDTSTLHNLIQQHGVSMLTSTDAMLMTPLHILCSNPTATITLIHMLKAAQPHAASMRNVMGKTPLMILLESKSTKYNAFHDEDGQMLPLVGLLEQRLDIDALEIIKSASSNDMLFASELHINDETSGLLPFMYGASLEYCGLDVVYELAMKLPDLLAIH